MGSLGLVSLADVDRPASGGDGAPANLLVAWPRRRRPGDAPSRVRISGGANLWAGLYGGKYSDRRCRGFADRRRGLVDHGAGAYRGLMRR